MTFKNGSLVCDWCGKTVIEKKDVTEHDIEFNIGWTRCRDCANAHLNKLNNLPRKGKLEDLPSDFFAPNDPFGRLFKTGKKNKGN